MPSIDRGDLEMFRSAVSRHLGLEHDESRLELLSEVLKQRLEVGAFDRVQPYLEWIASAREGLDEREALAERLVVAETYFFRNTDHFRALSEAVLPEVMRARGGDRRLRILSVGCASGEEPYSLAMAAGEPAAGLASWDVQIRGIDINRSLLGRAQAGRYSSWALRTTPAETQARYFRAEGRDFVLDEAIRKRVTFQERNLADEDALLSEVSSCDVVFCRNVLMYFAPSLARAVIRGISRALRSGGFLFLGHAETLRGLSDDYQLCHTHETFYYRLRGKADPGYRYPEGVASHGPFRSESLPTLVDSATSWIDVIRRASDRIALLADEPPTQSARSEASDAGGLTPTTAALSHQRFDVGRILEAVRQERFADALDVLRSLPVEAGQDPDALLLLAAVLTNTGKLDEARGVARQLLALDEFNPGAHYLMALCCEHAGDARAATHHDQTAVYLDPGFAMPHLHLGLIHKRSGDWDVARRELGQASLLLGRDDASRLLLFGGGFSREALSVLCRAECRSVGGVA